MPFSLSPSVEVRELDLTTTIPNVATSIGAIVGGFAWGPCNEITLVDSENAGVNSLVSRFSLPDSVNYKDWFAAADFLAYSKNLKVVRVVEDAAVNAGDTAGIAVYNETHYDTQTTALGTSLNSFVAKYPGVYGNKISVDVADSSSFTGWTYEDDFDYAPTGDEFWMVVLYDGNIVEKFTLSRDVAGKDYQGSNNYGPDVVARQSRYVWMVAANLITQTLGVDDPITGTYTLSGGLDSVDPTDAKRQLGYDLFANGEEVDINLVMQGGGSKVTGKYIVDNVTSTRLDCIALLSPEEDDVVGSATPTTDIIATRNSFGNSSYAVMDGNYKYRYDKYNDVYRWTPLNGDVAGLCARTDDVRDPWWSPGGYNRGQIKNAIKLAFNPSKTQRDELYKNAINPIVRVKGEGDIMLGDKTLLTAPSAFGYINVRRLFIVLEKAISTASKYMLFEFNDTFTQNRFKNMVVPYLRDVQGKRGIIDFLVVADETVNTGEVIDRGEFVADIYIKPSRSINNIYLNFIATKTGVKFEEVIGAI